MAGKTEILNHIEVGAISDFSGLFELFFNGNISQWDVSQGIYADNMFKNSAFEGSLADWDWQELRSAEWHRLATAYSASDYLSRCAVFIT